LFQHAFPHERSDLSHWRIRLGRIIRDIRRKIAGRADVEAMF
jgi:hypothetical protein